MRRPDLSLIPFRRRLVSVVILVIAGCSGGGSDWAFDTPVIDLPEDFRFASEPSARGRTEFPGRTPETRTAWEFHRAGDVSQILMVRYPNSTSPEEVWAEVNRLRAANQAWSFEGPNSRQVAGRPAWDWSASVPTQEGGLWATWKTLVVSFPDSTYVTSFWGQHPEWHDEARLDQVVASFRIPKAKRPLPKHPLFVLLLLAVIGTIAWIKRPRSGPARPMPTREPVHHGHGNVTMPTEPGRDPMVG